MRILRLPATVTRPPVEAWFLACIAMCVLPSRHPPRFAFPVPWRVSERDEDGLVVLVNESDAVLRSVRVTVAGGGVCALSLPARIGPGDELRVRPRGVVDDDGAPRVPDAMLLVRWFHPDGTELMWPIAW